MSLIGETVCDPRTELLYRALILREDFAWTTSMVEDLRCWGLPDNEHPASALLAPGVCFEIGPAALIPYWGLGGPKADDRFVFLKLLAARKIVGGKVIADVGMDDLRHANPDKQPADTQEVRQSLMRLSDVVFWVRLALGQGGKTIPGSPSAPTRLVINFSDVSKSPLVMRVELGEEFGINNRETEVAP